MHSFIINLASSLERREKMGKILRNEKFSYEFITAVDARKFDREQIAEIFNIEEAEIKYQKTILPGEVGCTMSHQKCYQKIVDCNLDYALIFEDDIEIIRPLDGIIQDIEKIMANETPRIILLSGWNYFTTKKRLNESYYLTKVIDGYLTHAYLINKSAAFLMKQEKPAFLADDWRYFIKSGVEIYGIHPHLINQDGNFVSDITAGQNRFSFSTGFVKRYFRKIWHLVFKIFGHYEKSDKDYIA